MRIRLERGVVRGQRAFGGGEGEREARSSPEPATTVEGGAASQKCRGPTCIIDRRGIGRSNGARLLDRKSQRTKIRGKWRAYI